MQQGNPQGDNGHLYDIRKGAGLAVGFIGLLAGVYRLPMYKPGSMGTHAVDGPTWIGVVFVLPIWVLYAGPPADIDQDRAFAASWLGLVILAILHRLAALANPVPRHSYEIGRPWAGKAELLVALALCGALLVLVGQGAATFFLAATVCNAVQVGMLRMKVSRTAQIAFDQRLEAGQYTEAMRRFEERH